MRLAKGALLGVRWAVNEVSRHEYTRFRRRGHETASDVSASFFTLDSFRDVASWVAAKRAEETPEGQEIMSAFKQANTCSANALYHGGGTVRLTDLHIKKGKSGAEKEVRKRGGV